MILCGKKKGGKGQNKQHTQKQNGAHSKLKKTKKKQLNMLSVSVTAVIIYRKKSIGPEVRQTIL